MGGAGERPQLDLGRKSSSHAPEGEWWGMARKRRGDPCKERGGKGSAVDTLSPRTEYCEVTLELWRKQRKGVRTGAERGVAKRRGGPDLRKHVIDGQGTGGCGAKVKRPSPISLAGRAVKRKRERVRSGTRLPVR